MSKQTKVVWENTVLTEQLKQVIADEITILEGQGKTDGTKVHTENDPIAGQNTNLRNWTDQAAAEEWITFINSLGSAPVSAEVLSPE